MDISKYGQQNIIKALELALDFISDDKGKENQFELRYWHYLDQPSNDGDDSYSRPDEPDHKYDSFDKAVKRSVALILDAPYRRIEIIDTLTNCIVFDYNGIPTKVKE